MQARKTDLVRDPGGRAEADRWTINRNLEWSAETLSTVFQSCNLGSRLRSKAEHCYEVCGKWRTPQILQTVFPFTPVAFIRLSHDMTALPGSLWKSSHGSILYSLSACLLLLSYPLTLNLYLKSKRCPFSICPNRSGSTWRILVWDGPLTFVVTYIIKNHIISFFF